MVVSAAAEIQRQRVLARPGMHRLGPASTPCSQRQLPDDEKRLRADFVVDTGMLADSEAPGR